MDADQAPAGDSIISKSENLRDRTVSRHGVRDEFDEVGWHDSIRGTCPNSNERMLED
ncbi:MAG: hypothetical protein HS116_06425 [Planctomycetes bacterium]|nr:hypothetical protein [Planctomycetota bacterium]